jgi:hypothetical protein
MGFSLMGDIGGMRFEAGQEIAIGWIGAVRPSRRPLSQPAQDEEFFHAIKVYLHPEEHPEGASQRTQGRSAALHLNSFPAFRPH